MRNNNKRNGTAGEDFGYVTSGSHSKVERQPPSTESVKSLDE
jgi:hypothetical protein